MVLSVIIPTYKRPGSLLRAVQSLQGQSFTDFEIVVVDNAADPDVAQTLKDFNRIAIVPVRYVPESNLGAHHARHAGARAANGEVLLFGDDDQTFGPGWVEAYARTFAEHPEMVAAGGPIRPQWESSPPQWLIEFMKGRRMFPILALMELFDKFRLDDKGVFFSANMAIRRTALFELGGFGPDLFGDRLMGDGETGLNNKLWERGMLVGYVPNAIAHHHIPRERMTVEYFRRRMANEGACDIYARFHHTMPGWAGLLGCEASIMLRNWVVWLIALLVSRRTDRLSLRLQLHAARSRGQLKYVSRLIRDKEFRQFVLKQDWLSHPCTSV